MRGEQFHQQSALEEFHNSELRNTLLARIFARPIRSEPRTRHHTATNYLIQERNAARFMSQETNFSAETLGIVFNEPEIASNAYVGWGYNRERDRELLRRTDHVHPPITEREPANPDPDEPYPWDVIPAAKPLGS